MASAGQKNSDCEIMVREIHDDGNDGRDDERGEKRPFEDELLFLAIHFPALTGQQIEPLLVLISS